MPVRGKQLTTITVRRGVTPAEPLAALPSDIEFVNICSAWPQSHQFPLQLAPGPGRVFVPFQGFDGSQWYDDAIAVYNRGGYLVGYVPRGFACECEFSIAAIESDEPSSIIPPLDFDRIALCDSLILAIKTFHQKSELIDVAIATEGLGAMVLLCAYVRSRGAETLNVTLSEALRRLPRWRRLLQHLGLTVSSSSSPAVDDPTTAQWLARLAGVEQELALAINTHSAVIPESCVFPKQ